MHQPFPLSPNTLRDQYFSLAALLPWMEFGSLKVVFGNKLLGIVIYASHSVILSFNVQCIRWLYQDNIFMYSMYMYNVQNPF